MRLICQPLNGHIGNEIISLLKSGNFDSLTFVVAFAKNSGVLRLREAFEKFRMEGGCINAYVGIDLGGTSFEALTSLLSIVDSLSIVHFDDGKTFHPKLYHFRGKEKEILIIGSSNMTSGGLWQNFESSIIISNDDVDIPRFNISNEFNVLINEINSNRAVCKKIKSPNMLRTLKERGYIDNEVELIARRQNTSVSQKNMNLFGRLPKVHLPLLPKKSLQKGKIELHGTVLSGLGKTLWFETRSMTGGSRNILDLSMQSLIEAGTATGTDFATTNSKYMRGSIEFFGVSPAATDTTKDITLNFEGVDYFGNTILFPKGNKANGTWRLQIKGVDGTGRKITEVFMQKDKAGYLKNKIISFTKIDGKDCYSMRIFPSGLLEEFRAASAIIARNGSSLSARQIGVL